MKIYSNLFTLFHRLKPFPKLYGIGNVLPMEKFLIPVKNTTPKHILMGEFYVNKINETKYIKQTFLYSYKTSMRLTINALNIMDYGQYFCVAKNEYNTTMATFEIISKCFFMFLLIKHSIGYSKSITLCFLLLLFLVRKKSSSWNTNRP